MTRVDGGDGTGRRAGAARILVVDDQPEPRRALGRVLEALGYHTEAAVDGEEALAKLPRGFDLVTLDAEMPLVDGFEVARRIRQNPATFNLPIIMVTGLAGRADRLRAFEAGVNDFLVKPFDLDEVRLRVHWLLKLKDAHDQLARHADELEMLVDQRTADLRQSLAETVAAERRTQEAHLDTIRRLVLAAEYKDYDTAAHIERIGRMSGITAEALGLPPREVDLIRLSTPMHDVGKIGVPDGILLKPGPLTADEWEIMRRHTVMGERLLAESPSELMQMGARVARSHHERWDGAGYPDGITGEAIPIVARICAVADVFDALATERRYRSALPLATVWGMMESEGAGHFDPQVLAAFGSRRAAVEAVRGSA